MENGKKYDKDKLKIGLLYKDLVLELGDVAKVMDFGASKYGPNNWQHLDNGVSRYTDAMLRHINSFLKGEYLDEESGLPHLAHAVCCILFIMYLSNKTNVDHKHSSDFSRPERFNPKSQYVDFNGVVHDLPSYIDATNDRGGL